LTNYAYIGKKEINKKKKTGDQERLPESERYRLVDAVWEPIVNEEKFYSAQALLKKNCISKHNEAKPVKHNYILNGGLLWCEKCGKEMEGRSGTGAKGVRYYYYICKNKECKFKVPADEIEGVVLKRIKDLSAKRDIMESIIKSTNEKLQKELPELKEQKTLLQKELTEIKNFADGIMNKWASLASEDSSLFLKDKLDQLGKRRKEIETGVQALDEMIEEIERESVTQELVILALNKFTDVFEHIQPYQQKELLNLVLHKAILAPDRIKIALYGRPPEIGLLPLCESEMRSQIPVWLPINSLLSSPTLQSAKRRRKKPVKRLRPLDGMKNSSESSCEMSDRQWRSWMKQADSRSSTVHFWTCSDLVRNRIFCMSITRIGVYGTCTEKI
jgi:hypothetical protein